MSTGLTAGTKHAISVALADPAASAEVHRILKLANTPAAAITAIVPVYTAGAPSYTPNKAPVVANGAAPTVVELLDMILELNAQINEIRTKLAATATTL